MFFFNFKIDPYIIKCFSIFSNFILHHLCLLRFRVIFFKFLKKKNQHIHSDLLIILSKHSWGNLLKKK